MLGHVGWSGGIRVLMIPAPVSTALVQRGCESDNGDETPDNDTGDGIAGQRGARINGNICGDRTRCGR